MFYKYFQIALGVEHLDILQMLNELDTNTSEFGISTIVMFILLGLVIQIIQELIINDKK